MGIKPISVLQCNVQRSYASQHELVCTFMSNKYSICLITEPYTGSASAVHNIQGVDVFQFPAGSTTAGSPKVKACILVKQSAAIAIGCSQHSTPNLAVIQINIAQRRLFVASAYI